MTLATNKVALDAYIQDLYPQNIPLSQAEVVIASILLAGGGGGGGGGTIGGSTAALQGVTNTLLAAVRDRLADNATTPVSTAALQTAGNTSLADLLTLIGETPTVDGANPDIRGYLKLISDRLNGSAAGTIPAPTTGTATNVADNAVAADPNRQNWRITNHSTTNEIIYFVIGHDAVLTPNLNGQPLFAGQTITPEFPLEAQSRVSVISANPAPYSVQTVLKA